MIDLEAIKKRQRNRRYSWLGIDTSDSNVNPLHRPTRHEAVADIDALIAEVERLRTHMDKVDSMIGDARVVISDGRGVRRTTVREWISGENDE